MVDLRKPFWLNDDGEGVEGGAKILLEILHKYIHAHVTVLMPLP